MDGLLNSLLLKSKHTLHKFEIPKSREWGIEFYKTSKRLPKLKELALNMIDMNVDEINYLLDTIVSERFIGKYTC